MKWTGQCIINRTSNGYVVFPKLTGDGQALPAEIAVVEGHDSYGRLANALKSVYQRMDAKPVATPTPMPAVEEKVVDESVPRISQDKEPERKLV